MRRSPVIILLILGLRFICGAADGDALAAIVGAGRDTRSIECDFIQTRQSSLLGSAAVSRGRMSFRSPDVLRWEYTEPLALSLSMEGGKVTVIRDGVTQKQGDGAGRMFGQIARMVTGGITGRTLTDSRSFETSVREENGEYVAVLNPVGSAAARMLSSLVIHFDRKSLCAVRMEIYEKNGDSTVIEFVNIRKESVR